MSHKPNGQHANPLPDPEVVPEAQRRQFSAEYKRRVLQEYEACAEMTTRGALLRREGRCSSTAELPLFRASSNNNARCYFKANRGTMLAAERGHRDMTGQTGFSARPCVSAENAHNPPLAYCER